MKISQFRSLWLWLALVGCCVNSIATHAGDLARARAKLTATPTAATSEAVTANNSSGSEHSTLQTAGERPVLEVAARPRLLGGSGPASSPATQYKPAAPTYGTPTLAPPRPTTSPSQPYIVTPSVSTSAVAMPPAATPSIAAPAPAVKVDEPATAAAPAGSETTSPSLGVTSSRVVEPGRQNPLTASTGSSRRNDDSKRVYHNSLRPEPKADEPNVIDASTPSLASPSAAPSPMPITETAAPIVATPIVKQPVESETPASSIPPKNTPTLAPPKPAPSVAAQAPLTTPTPAASKPAAAAPATAAPALTPRPSAVVGRATDAPPLRTADPSQPGRLPPLSGEREPGEPEHEQRMTITRTPADEQTKKMFETKEAKPLTPELELLRGRVQTALALYYKNWTLNTQQHSPWEVMHAIIAYGVDTKLRTNGGRETTTAIGHLCYSGVCRNQPILTIRNDELYALRGPGVQGHPGQFLAILAQSYLQRDYPLYVGGRKFTLEDLIKAEMKDCEAGTELTFKLISLMHYLPSDATWTNFQGQKWSLDRLVREEIVQPVRGAACGGTHRLMGLSYAIRKREQRGEPIDGIYLEAKKYIDQYHKYTYSLQNPDGSFSTAWFVRREARNDIDRRMQTTGHILEWLAFSLSDEQLRDPRVVKAVKYVTDILLNEHYTQWEVGHLGHGLHALQIYNERVFGGEVRSFDGLITRKPAAATAAAPRVR
ncbi:MAG: hypothetical protein QM775_30545 [Pirellulales bacterium]